MSSIYETMPHLDFKRGDSLKIDMTVQDTNNEVSLALKITLDTKIAILNDLLENDPTNEAAIIAAQDAVDIAQAAYDSSIIVSIVGWTIRSQVRYSKRLIDEIEIVIIDAVNGVFALVKDEVDTAEWPIRPLTCDVEFIRPEGKVSSETFVINVIEDQTI